MAVQPLSTSINLYEKRTLKNQMLPASRDDDEKRAVSHAATQLKNAIDSSPQAIRQRKLQEMADSRPQLKMAGPANTGVAQLASKMQVARVLGHPAGSSAPGQQAIVDDLSKQTGGKEITFDESDGVPWVQTKREVRAAAKSLAYSDDAADRLIAKNPYKQNEIKTKSTAHKESGKVTSFLGLTGVSTPPRHKLYFENSYLAGKWTMGENFRNPYLASFYGNQAIDEQKKVLVEKGGDPGELRKLVRASVSSETGVKWAKDNTIRNGPLSEEHWKSFLLTENGKNSKKIADDSGVKIVGGTVSNLEPGGPMAYKFFDVELTCKPLGEE